MHVEHPQPRPGGVTFLVVLGVIQGLVALLGGLATILGRGEAELQQATELTSDQLVVFGVVMVVLGFVVVIASLALGSGSSFIRMLYALATMFNVAAGIYLLVVGRGEERLPGALNLVFGLMVLFILFSDRADRFFRTN